MRRRLAASPVRRAHRLVAVPVLHDVREFEIARVDGDADRFRRLADGGASNRFASLEMAGRQMP